VASVVCTKCLRHFPVERSNTKQIDPPGKCSACNGTGTVVERQEVEGKGQAVQVSCGVCGGEGTIQFVARCTLMYKGAWCQTTVAVPVYFHDQLPWLGKPDPSTPESHNLRKRGLNPQRYVRRKGGSKWPL
jgi:hypothetical protein